MVIPATTAKYLNFKIPSHRAVRQYVYTRDDFTCQWCGYRPPTERISLPYTGHESIYYPEPLQLDHIRPRCGGGDHSVFNLRVLCGSCNARKGTADKAAKL